MMEYALRMERYDTLSLARDTISCHAHTVSSGRNNSPSHLIRPLYPLRNLRVAKKTTPQAKKAAVQIPRAVTVRSAPALLLTHEAFRGSKFVLLQGRSVEHEREKYPQRIRLIFDATTYG